MLSAYGDAAPTGAMVEKRIEPGFPAPFSDPLAHVRTAGAVPGESLGDWPEASANFEYVTPSEGGQEGSTGRNGYSTGIMKLDRNVHHFTGASVIFTRRDLRYDTGPVGQDNYGDKLAAGVEQQVTEYPSLQDIALSLVRGN